MNTKIAVTVALLAGLTVPTQFAPSAQAQDLNDIRRRIEEFIRPNNPSPGPNPPSNPNLPNRPTQGGTLTNSEGAITRAMNLARQAAERENGGLNVYRAESSMYGPSERAPYVVNRDNTVTFTFLGGKPAEPPTIQSVVTVTPDGSKVNIDYNGPVRSANSPDNPRN
jgi:hypothetical protein